MPETPDFEQIARASIEALELDDYEFGSQALRARIVEQLAEQLRLVWNARGAADLAQLDAVKYAREGTGLDKTRDRAIRSLDR